MVNLKIALVTDTYFPRVNGVSTSTKIFSETFKKMGYEVHIYAPHYSDDEETSTTVHRFPSWYLWFDPEDRVARTSNPALIKSFIEEKFDIVHTQTPFTLGKAAITWGRQTQSKIIHTYHTLFTSYVEHYLWFIPKLVSIPWTRRYSRTYCNACDRIIAPSQAMKQELLSYHIEKPIDVVPTGIDVDKFEGKNPVRFRNKYGFNSSDRILLFMGRVAKEKNIDFLLKVFEGLNNKVTHLRLLIAGEGPDKKRLMNLVQKMKLEKKVFFVGYLRDEDWKDCYAAADIFIFASITETQGLVVTEAMMAGTPVVAVSAMGVKDVMQEERGGILVKLDVEDFTNAIFKLLTNTDLYEQKKSETIIEAQKWSSMEMAKKMIKIYESL